MVRWQRVASECSVGAQWVFNGCFVGGYHSGWPVDGQWETVAMDRQWQ